MTMMLFTAVAIVREWERGNLELLITMPASSFELMIGKRLPYVFIGLSQATSILMVGGAARFNAPVNGWGAAVAPNTRGGSTWRSNLVRRESVFYLQWAGKLKPRGQVRTRLAA